MPGYNGIDFEVLQPLFTGLDTINSLPFITTMGIHILVQDDVFLRSLQKHS